MRIYKQGCNDRKSFISFDQPETQEVFENILTSLFYKDHDMWWYGSSLVYWQGLSESSNQKYQVWEGEYPLNEILEIGIDFELVLIESNAHVYVYLVEGT